jgi:DNA repair exonuclease SbcCD ATPase subunit
VIAINIVAAKTGEPSSLIAEMDVRGKAMAVGVNGVGKTTFLRTIPLFYGALPKDILKGTHRGSMIAYTLPSISSAIVYEYERDTEDDLRCAVMYRKPNEDEAVFYIMRGGYQELFFVDENNDFVDAPTFKARAEADGVWVSQALSPSQYRSVILREKPMTKNAAKLRELALEHSLGPKELRNLGPIAAAISTEKINFDDLRRIVVDRVTQDTISASPDGILAQKPIKEDIKRWLDTREHVASILAKAQDAERLKEKAAQLQRRHKRLCALNAAAKRSIQQCLEQKGDLDKEIEKLRTTSTEHAQRLQGDISEIDKALEGMRAGHGRLELAIQSTEKQLEYFKEKKIEELIELHERQPILEERLKDTSKQLGELRNKAKDANARATALLQSIQDSHTNVMLSLGARRSQAQTDNKTALEALREEEGTRKKALKEPPELAELRQSLLQLERRKGGLEAQLKTPQASQETLGAIEELEGSISALEEAQEQREKEEESSLSAQHRAASEAKASSEALEAINTTIERAHGRLAGLQAELSPEDGTLLAFLRSHDESAWKSAAKALAPELLRRRDLDPDMLDEAGTQERILVGPLSIDVTAVATPDWVNETDLKHRIEEQQRALGELRQKLTEAQALVASKGKALRAADGDLAAARAKTAMAREALKVARQQRESLRERAAQERRDAAGLVQRALDELHGQIEDAQARLELVLGAIGEKEAALEEEFRNRRQAINDTLAGELENVGKEEKAANSHLSARTSEIKAELAKELEGKGVAPETLERLEGELSEVQSQLERISASQGDIKSWKSFKDGALAELPTKVKAEEELSTRIKSESARRSQLATDLERFNEQVRQQAETLVQRRNAAESGASILTNLRDTTLKDFVDYVALPDVEMTPEAIRGEAMEALSALGAETNEVQSITRALRNEMLRHDDQIADWLQQKERDDLPDVQSMLAHEYELRRAEIVCRWFDKSEHGDLLAELNKERTAIFMAAGGFADALISFDQRVDEFSRSLKKALSQIPSFHSIGELKVDITSGVGKLDYLKVLNRIKDRHRALSGTIVSMVAGERELPGEEDTALMKEYRNILQPDGGYSVNFRDQINLECSLRENNNHHVVRNAQEFAAISSTGLTALITSLFLMGFVQMIRNGEREPAITWPTDEIARLDSKNVASFLKTLADARINVVCAAPNADPALARHFERVYSFEDDGSIATPRKKGASA